jgi:anti-sigma regulatory factor (Ser/Thr protein kinase)
VHQAFLYDSQDAFVAAMAPFVRDGLESGDPVLAATTAANVAALREELGDDAARVDLRDTTAWMTHPYERLQAFRKLAASVPAGGTLRAIGEPVWEGSDAAIRQWAQYASIVNLALADRPMRFVCLYDAGGLPDDILEYATSTHPEQLVDGAAAPCGDYVMPAEFRPPGGAGRPAAVAPLPLGLRELRDELTRQARAAGIDEQRTADLALAAHEVATNAVRHGREPLSAYAWTEGEELICQVTDAGPCVRDPLAGWLPSVLGAGGGWGLAIARQLCDAVEIASNASGTVVSLHLALRPDEAPSPALRRCGREKRTPPHPPPHTRTASPA